MILNLCQKSMLLVLGNFLNVLDSIAPSTLDVLIPLGYLCACVLSSLSHSDSL